MYETIPKINLTASSCFDLVGEVDPATPGKVGDPIGVVFHAGRSTTDEETKYGPKRSPSPTW